jgi:hypothetical protein
MHQQRLVVFVRETKLTVATATGEFNAHVTVPPAIYRDDRAEDLGGNSVAVRGGDTSACFSKPIKQKAVRRARNDEDARSFHRRTVVPAACESSLGHRGAVHRRILPRVVVMALISSSALLPESHTFRSQPPLKLPIRPPAPSFLLESLPYRTTAGSITANPQAA